MRSIFAAGLMIFLFSCSSNTETKPPARTSSRHSAAFNKSFDSVMNTYYRLTEAFVNWDSTAVQPIGKNLMTRLDSLSLGELNSEQAASVNKMKDFSKALLSRMVENKSITDKRQDFNLFSQSLFALLRDAEYDQETIYLNKCPMAFHDEEEGDWVSNKEGIRNPYLGLHHPTYGDAMIDCGEVKDSLTAPIVPSDKRPTTSEDKNTGDAPKSKKESANK